MLPGGAHIINKNQRKVNEAFKPPSYHWQGFGSKSTIPPWYANSKTDGRKPLIQWEGDSVGYPLKIPKKLGKKAPYNHSDDERLYRPTVPDRVNMTKLVSASDVDRQHVNRGNTLKDLHGRFLELGVAERNKVYNAQSVTTREIGRTNKLNNVKTQMEGIIKYEEFPQQSQIMPYSRTRRDFGY